MALIAGPTASGKTALALHLAKKRNIVIINADSAQVYSDLPILSAQPSPEELASTAHRLFGYLGGATPCSAAQWAADAKLEIANAHQSDALPVLVGGTGLYLRTLLDGIAPIPAIDPLVRAAIRSQNVVDSFAALQSLDPVMADVLSPTDSSRIARALEVVQTTGRSIADWRQDKVGGIADDVDLRPVLLLPPRDWLYQRCDQRFDGMMDAGALHEVSALLARNLPGDAPVMRAIGVREISACLSGEIAHDEAIRLGKIATRQYAKRQYTWFRNQSPEDWARMEDVICIENGNNIERLLQ